MTRQLSTGRQRAVGRVRPSALQQGRAVHLVRRRRRSRCRRPRRAVAVHPAAAAARPARRHRDADGTAQVDASASSAGVPSRPSAAATQRLGQGGVPADRVAAQAFSSFNSATVVTVGARHRGRRAGRRSPSPGPARARSPTGTCRSASRNFAVAIVVIDQRGSGTYAENVEFVLGDSAQLTVVVDRRTGPTTRCTSARITRGWARTRCCGHVTVTLGGDLVRLPPTVRFAGPGGDAELLGLYFADDGQHFESAAAGRPRAAALQVQRAVQGCAARRSGLAASPTRTPSGSATC